MARAVEITVTGHDAGAEAMLTGLQGRLGGLSRAGAAAGGGFTKMMGGLSAPFNAVSGGLTKILTLRNMLFAGAGGMLVNSVMNYGDAIDEASVKTGVSTDALQALNLQATVNKGSFEGVTKGLAVMARNAMMATEGENEASRAFAALGVNVTNAEGKLRPMEEILADVAEGVSRMTNDTERAAVAQRIFGRGGMEMMGVLREGRKGLEAYRAELTRRGMRMSPEQIKQLADLKDKLAVLKMQGMGVLAQILGGGAAGEGSKAIETLMTKIAELAKSGALNEFAVKFAQSLATTFKAMQEFAAWVGDNQSWLKWVGGGLLAGKVVGDVGMGIRNLHAVLGPMEGRLGAVGAAAATAFAGWEIGKKIGEVTGLHEVLSNLILKVQGIKAGPEAAITQEEEAMARKGWAMRHGSVGARDTSGRNFEEWLADENARRAGKEVAKRTAPAGTETASLWTGDTELDKILRRAEEVSGRRISGKEAMAAAEAAGRSTTEMEKSLVAGTFAETAGAPGAAGRFGKLAMAGVAPVAETAGVGAPPAAHAGAGVVEVGAGTVINIGSVEVNADDAEEFAAALERPMGAEQL